MPVDVTVPVDNTWAYLQGDLVGINTAFIGATSSNPGMGFAIPVNMAHIVIDQIVEAGEIRRGSLGISHWRSAKLPAQPIDTCHSIFAIVAWETCVCAAPLPIRSTAILL